MKLALFSLALSSLALFPNTLAAAIDLSEGSTDLPTDSPTDSPTDLAKKGFPDFSTDDSTDSTTEASEFLPPLSIDFQLNAVTNMEALNFITNLTNSLIAEVSQYAELNGISVTDLLSFPCTLAEAPADKDGLRF